MNTNSCPTNQRVSSRDHTGNHASPSLLRHISSERIAHAVSQTLIISNHEIIIVAGHGPGTSIIANSACVPHARHFTAGIVSNGSTVCTVCTTCAIHQTRHVANRGTCCLVVASIVSITRELTNGTCIVVAHVTRSIGIT